MGIDLKQEVKHAEFRNNMINFLKQLGIILNEPQENFSDEELVDRIKDRLNEMLNW